MNFLKYFTPDYTGVLVSENEEGLLIKFLNFFEPFFNLISQVDFVILVPIILVFAIVFGYIKSGNGDLSNFVKPTLSNPILSVFLIVITLKMMFIPTNINLVLIKDNSTIKIINKIENVPRLLAILTSISAPILYGVTEAPEKKVVGDTYPRFDKAIHFFHIGMFVDGNWRTPYVPQNKRENLDEYRKQISKINADDLIKTKITTLDYEFLVLSLLENYKHCTKTSSTNGFENTLGGCKKIFSNHPLTKELISSDKIDEILESVPDSLGSDIFSIFQDKEKNIKIYQEALTAYKLSKNKNQNGLFSTTSMYKIGVFNLDYAEKISKTQKETFCTTPVKKTNGNNIPYYVSYNLRDKEVILKKYDETIAKCNTLGFNAVQTKTEVETIIDEENTNFDIKIDKLIQEINTYITKIKSENITEIDGMNEKLSFFTNYNVGVLTNRFLKKTSNIEKKNFEDSSYISTDEKDLNNAIYTLFENGTFSNKRKSSIYNLKNITETINNDYIEDFNNLLSSFDNITPLKLYAIKYGINYNFNSDVINEFQEMIDKIYISWYFNKTLIKNSNDITQRVTDFYNVSDDTDLRKIIKIKVINSGITVEYGDEDVKEIAEAIEDDQINRIDTVINIINDSDNTSWLNLYGYGMNEADSEIKSKIGKEHILFSSMAIVLSELLKQQKELTSYINKSEITQSYDLATIINYNSALNSFSTKLSILSFYSSIQQKDKLFSINSIRVLSNISYSIRSLVLTLMKQDNVITEPAKILFKYDSTYEKDVFIPDEDLIKMQNNDSGVLITLLKQVLGIQALSEPIIREVNNITNYILNTGINFSFEGLEEDRDYKAVIIEGTSTILDNKKNNLFAMSDLYSDKENQSSDSINDFLQYKNVNIADDKDESIKYFKLATVLPNIEADFDKGVFDFLSNGMSLEYEMLENTPQKKDFSKFVGLNLLITATKTANSYNIYKSFQSKDAESIMLGMKGQAAWNALETVITVIPGGLLLRSGVKITTKVGSKVLKSVKNSSKTLKASSYGVKSLSKLLKNRKIILKKTMEGTKKIIKGSFKKLKKTSTKLKVMAAIGTEELLRKGFSKLLSNKLNIIIYSLFLYIFLPIILSIIVLFLLFKILRYALVDILFPLIKIYFTYVLNYIKSFLKLINTAYKMKEVFPKEIFEELIEKPLINGVKDILLITFKAMVFIGITIGIQSHFIFGELNRNIFRFLVEYLGIYDVDTFTLELSTLISTVVGLSVFMLFINVLKNFTITTSKNN